LESWPKDDRSNQARWRFDHQVKKKTIFGFLAKLEKTKKSENKERK
jgi:hypothetical protein